MGNNSGHKNSGHDSSSMVTVVIVTVVMVTVVMVTVVMVTAHLFTEGGVIGAVHAALMEVMRYYWSSQCTEEHEQHSRNRMDRAS